jgi:hypothetical protein
VTEETEKAQKVDLDASRVRAVGVLKANALAWLAVILLLGAGLYWDDRRAQDRQREICGLIIVSDDAYRANPPSLAGGKAFAKALHDYRNRIGCQDTPLPAPAKS